MCAYIWAGFHYEFDFFGLFSELNLRGVFEVLQAMLFQYSLGLFLTVIFCVLSKLLSNKYAALLGKE